MNEIDFSEFRKLFLEKGKSIEIKKGNYFVRQNEPSKFVGFIEDFVCDYSSLVRYSKSLTNAQVVSDCMYIVVYKAIKRLLGNKYGYSTLWKVSRRRNVHRDVWATTWLLLRYGRTALHYYSVAQIYRSILL